MPMVFCLDLDVDLDLGIETFIVVIVFKTTFSTLPPTHKVRDSIPS
jgi:hypothetical protein